MKKIFALYAIIFTLCAIQLNVNAQTRPYDENRNVRFNGWTLYNKISTFVDSSLFLSDVRITGAFRNTYLGFSLLNTGTSSGISFTAGPSIYSIGIQKSTDTTAGIAYYTGTGTSHSIAVNSTAARMKYLRTASLGNYIYLTRDSFYVKMNNIIATLWDTTGNAFFTKKLLVTNYLQLNNDSTYLFEDGGSSLLIQRKENSSPNTAWILFENKGLSMGTFQNYYYIYDIHNPLYSGFSHTWYGNGKFNDSLTLEGGFMRLGVATDSNYIYTTAGGALYMKHKAGILNRGIFYMDDGECSFGTTSNSIYFEEGISTEIDGNTTILDSLNVNGSVNVTGNITARHKPKSGTVASAAEPTINTDLVDAYDITALATNITSFTTNLSGTPVNFQQLLIRIKDNATPRTLTWGASFASGGVTLPVTTVASKNLLVLLIYNSTTGKWVCWAADNEQ